MTECPECGEPAVDEPHVEHVLYGNTHVCLNMHRWPCECEDRRPDERRLKEDTGPEKAPGKGQGKRYRHGGRKGSRSRKELK